MTEILALLDAAIEEVGQRVGSSSRSSRQGGDVKSAAGTVKPLKSNTVPAVPVVPVKNDAIHDGPERIRENTLAPRNPQDVARVEYTFKNTGTTGTTGINQDSCGPENFRTFVAHGNKGKFRGSRSDEAARVDETPTAACQFDGVPMEWRNGIARLRGIPVPSGIPEAQWTGIVATANELLERWGAQLVALGWTAADVFGADQYSPWHRLDCMGLVTLLRDRELTAVTAEMAILTTRSGATHRFYRRHPALGRPLWELVR